jgi:hypothetical protein
MALSTISSPGAANARNAQLFSAMAAVARSPGLFTRSIQITEPEVMSSGYRDQPREIPPVGAVFWDPVAGGPSLKMTLQCAALPVVAVIFTTSPRSGEALFTIKDGHRPGFGSAVSNAGVSDSSFPVTRLAGTAQEQAQFAALAPVLIRMLADEEWDDMLYRSWRAGIQDGLITLAEGGAGGVAPPAEVREEINSSVVLALDLFGDSKRMLLRGLTDTDPSIREIWRLAAVSSRQAVKDRDLGHAGEPKHPTRTAG